MDALEPIKRKIYDIRGHRVMLDSDLAELYMVETKYLKRAVRANIERFPPDFMFELTKEEYDSLRCKYFTLKTGRGQHSKYLPFAFTREGIAMLADQNDINELTRAQLDAISDALMELQNQGKNPLALPEIGYTAIQKRREEEEKENK